jgi:hypothetical protein
MHIEKRSEDNPGLATVVLARSWKQDLEDKLRDGSGRSCSDWHLVGGDRRVLGGRAN